jgi:hypothetical protein
VVNDEFQAITVVPDEDGVSLRERSLLAAVARMLCGLVLLAVGLLVVFALLGSGGPRPAGHGLTAWLGWGVIGLFATALGLLPIGVGITFIGVRSEYSVRQSGRRLWAVTRLLGLVIRSRPYLFSDFQQVGIRHVRRGPFRGAWQFVARCEGQVASLEIATCSQYQRACMVAGSLARQLGLPVRFECDQGRCAEGNG